MPEPDFDVALVGGGLHNTLAALALLHARPGIRIALCESAPRLGGEHTWCFQEGDLPSAARAFVSELVEFRWTGYDVAFPGFRRHLASPYAGFTGQALDRVLREKFGAAPASELLLGCPVTEIRSTELSLADGRTVRAGLVLDARGPEHCAPNSRQGYQVFFGQELELERPHGLTCPVLMDACVPQKGGYRFFYLLPFDETRLLVEDTRFSDESEIHVDAMRSEIAHYCAQRGFEVRRILREESGSLPMPWAGPRPELRASPVRTGYAGAWLHPATGYSFPVGVRFASLLAELGPEGILGAEGRRFCRGLRRQQRFARLLNRLLFGCFRPQHRLHVFERFYRLPEQRIRRFYALETTLLDRLRILVGRPPRGFTLRPRHENARREHELARL